MARTQTLQEMVSNLRAEAGHSLAVAQGTNTEQTLKYILKRTQEELWTSFTWPELTIRDDRAMQAGLYVYDYGVNLKFDMIREAYATTAANTGRWSPVNYGISETRRIPGSGANTSDSDPVQFWEADGSKFRVYPTPLTATWVRFKGNKELSPLIANSDSSTLDATCILLFAASELLARSKAEDAATKLQKAQRHLLKLQGNQVSAKNKISTYGSTAPATIVMRHTDINA